MKLMMRLVAAAAAGLSYVTAASTNNPECIAPAKPGGGFDLTCKLAQRGLQTYLKEPIRITHLPGGIGAVAFNAIVAQRPAEGNTIVAFSSGSLLNIAQGKFGKYSEGDVRWLAAMAVDYGVIAVRTDAPHQSLKEFIAAMKRDPKQIVFGTGGSIGGQDWIKAALIARAAGVDPKNLRFAAFEGGGEALTALLGGHVQAFSGDALEVAGSLNEGRIRLLAVLSPTRLPGALKDVPTAKEQGIDVTWPTVRGFYVGPKVSDADYRYWVNIFNKMLASKEFAELCAERSLFPFPMTGAELDDYVKTSVPKYLELAKEFGLVK